MSWLLKLATISALLCLAYAVVNNSTAFAKTLTVSQTGAGQFRRIQDAINAASFGDTVFVDTGIYNEHIDFKDGITLQGKGQTFCRVEYGGNNTVVTARNITSGIIDGFTFAYTGVGNNTTVWIVSSSLKISNNTVRGAVWNGIEVNGSINTTIEKNIITANKASGIFIHSNSKATIAGNEITNNGLQGVTVDVSSTTITGNNITNNQQSGIFIYSNSIATVAGNNITNNTGGGIYIDSNSKATITGNNITSAL